MITVKARCTCGPHQPFRATEMIDFCAEHGVMAQVEVTGADAIDEAYQRVLAGDVSFRLVIDVSTMRDTKAAPPIAELKARLA